jgi:hypothetical protein
MNCQQSWRFPKLLTFHSLTSSSLHNSASGRLRNSSVSSSVPAAALSLCAISGPGCAGSGDPIADEVDQCSQAAQVAVASFDAGKVVYSVTTTTAA